MNEQQKPSAEGSAGWLLSEVIGRPVSVVIGALGALVLGVFSLWRLPVSLLPTLERPRLEIVAWDADLSRDELEAQVVSPLERRLQTLDGVLDVVSTVDDGKATLVLDTEWQTDVDRLRIEVERRLVGRASAGLDALTVDVDSGDDRPILRVAVHGPSASMRTSFADRVLLPELGRLPGAGRLALIGGADLRPVVTPRSADLAAHDLIAADLVKSLEAVGRDRPLGRLRQGGSLRPLLMRFEIRDLEALRGLSVNTAGLSLREVADVYLQEVPRGGLARVQGEPAVLVELYRAPGANAVRLSREARETIDRLALRASPLRVTVAEDSSQEVVDSLLQLAQAGLLGLALGTLVLRLLLGSWRPTLALVVVVPVSVLAAFSAFLLAEVSLDLVSLAGLALAAGMLVDNSVVVLEAIASARERRQSEPILAGSQQIAMALVASFLTTAVVFLPLIYLRGLARAFFGVQAFAIVSTLALSLVLSLTLTPVLARFGAGRSSSDAAGIRGGRQPGRELYLRLLDRGLRRPLPGLIVAALVLAGVAGVVPRLPRELVPAGTSRVLIAEARLPVGTDGEEATRRLLALEAELRPVLLAVSEAAGDPVESMPVAWSILQRAPSQVATSGQGSLETTEPEPTAYVAMTFPSPAALELAVPAVQRAISAVPGLAMTLERRPSAVSAAIERTASLLEVEISASTPNRLAELRGRVESELEQAGWSAPHGRWSSWHLGAEQRPAWWLSWRPVRLAKLETSAQDLALQLRSGLEARRLGRTSIAGVEPDIHFAGGGGDLRSMTVRVAAEGDNRVLPLAALADLETRRQPPPRHRRNGRPTARLEVAGGAGDASRLEQTLAQLPLAADSEVRLAGQTQELRRSFSQLRLALGLALLLVFLTVAALYESLRLPLVVMVTVPTASAGAFLGLLITGQSLNVMSLLGLILLTGIVVNNAIVLLHRAEQHRALGLAAVRAIRLAASERYRPILMTTLTTLLGMVPLALLGGEGLELRRALAVSVSGGLITSWAAALLVVPRLYVLVAGREQGIEAESADSAAAGHGV